MSDRYSPDLIPCPSCGRGVSASFDDCLFCHEPLPRPPADPEVAEGGGQVVSAEPASPPPAEPRQPSIYDPPAPRIGQVSYGSATSSEPGAPDGRFQSPVGRSYVALGLLAAHALMLAYLAVLGILEIGVVDSVVDGTDSALIPELIDVDDRRVIVGGIEALLTFVTGIAFIAWLYRLYDNASAIDRWPPRFSSGWVVGAWFVPFLSLVRPKAIVDDQWRISDPERDPAAAGRWEGAPVPGWLHLWWAAFLAHFILIGRFTDYDPNDLVALRAQLPLEVLANVVGVVAAGLAFWLVISLTRRHMARARVVGVETVDDRSGAPSLALVGVLLGAVVVVAGVGLVYEVSREVSGDETTLAEDEPAVVAASPPPATLPEYATGEPVALDQLVIGDCWSPPRSGFDAAGVTDLELVSCDEPHLGEIYAEVTHEDGDYPGDTAVVFDGQRRCIDAFEEALDMKYEEAPYDIYWIWPSEPSWLAGERRTQCSYTAAGVAPLRAPASRTAQRLPGVSRNVSGATSCDDLAGYTLSVAEAYARRLDGMTLSELEALEAGAWLPGMERYWKREATVILRAYELGCTLAQVNDLVAERIGELTPESLASTAFLSSVRTDGYFDESLIP